MSTPVVLITGALAGIGRETALAFAEDHAKIVVSGRQQDKGEALVKELKAKGAEAEFVKADVRYEKEVSALIDRAISRFGRLDIAVNNAGVVTPRTLDLEDAATFAEVFEPNVLGTIFSLKHEFRVMKTQGKGSIVNVSSLYGHRGFQFGASYVASKHAVEGLTRCAALEGAPVGIRVNAVAPGTIETDMFARVTGGNADVKNMLESSNPQKRIGAPKEVAELIKFLGSDKSPYINGEIVTIDGGVGAG
jgi:NAD(P)-dependent dehydrogenase (short-subunit alcohol dehydrogenase family)